MIIISTNFKQHKQGSGESIMGTAKRKMERYAISALDSAMQVLEEKMLTVFEQTPLDLRASFDNALLNLAVNRIIAMEGEQVTSGILWRLADVIASGVKPTIEEPVELTGYDA
tara:strand:+ start:77 stop:415 length:339 start_codon:yes stop_codon:yes gene_type:complete